MTDETKERIMLWAVVALALLALLSMWHQRPSECRDHGAVESPIYGGTR